MHSWIIQPEMRIRGYRAGAEMSEPRQLVCQAGIALLGRAMQYARQVSVAGPKADGLYSRRKWDNMQTRYHQPFVTSR